MRSYEMAGIPHFKLSTARGADAHTHARSCFSFDRASLGDAAMYSATVAAFFVDFGMTSPWGCARLCRAQQRHGNSGNSARFASDRRKRLRGTFGPNRPTVAAFGREVILLGNEGRDHLSD